MPIIDRNIRPAGTVVAGSTYAGIDFDKLREDFERVKDVTVTSAQILALNATPVSLIAAPGVGKAIIFKGAIAATAGGTAYAGIAATEEFSFKYTNGSGLNVGTIETTGWLDQTTAQARFVHAHASNITTDVPDSFVPVANAALVAHMVVGEITTGDYSIRLRIFYRIVPTTVAGIV